MTTLVELCEYEDFHLEAPLGEEQLRSLSEAHIGVTPLGGDRYTLRPSSLVGVLSLGDLSVVVRPKIPIDRVMFMISYALDIGAWRREHAPLANDPDLLEATIPAFAHHTQRAIRRGLLQGYRHEDHALQTVRGRIRFGEQIRHRFGIPLPIEVSFDDFTEDIEENRMLRTALHILGRMPVRSPHARQSVRALRPAFASVTLGSYRRGAVPEIAYSRLNEHYKPAVELARLIIESSSLELRHGEVASTAFMIDMNRVFERFLRAALRKALPVRGPQWPEEDRERRLTLDKAEEVRLIPDLMWRDERTREPIFVGDAKYKRIVPAGWPHADIYQMLAYCTAADLPSGLLVYAAGEEAAAIHEIERAAKTIEVATLDLTGTANEMLAEVERLAGSVKAHRCRASGGSRAGRSSQSIAGNPEDARAPCFGPLPARL